MSIDEKAEFEKWCDENNVESMKTPSPEAYSTGLEVWRKLIAKAPIPDQACQDEGCPHHGRAIKCEPKEGGCIATVPKQPVECAECAKYERVHQMALQKLSETQAELLKLRIATKRESSWQPIETAPRDGTPFLAWEGGCIYKSYWHRTSESFSCIAGQPVAYTPEPSYWMPIPADPSESEEQGRRGSDE